MSGVEYSRVASNASVPEEALAPRGASSEWSDKLEAPVAAWRSCTEVKEAQALGASLVAPKGSFTEVEEARAPRAEVTE